MRLLHDTDPQLQYPLNGPQNRLLSRFLDDAGDGSGTKNANGDYSGATEIFYIQPPAGTIYRISRIIITVGDTNGFQAQEYGNLGSALATGVKIRVSDSTGILVDMMDGSTAKTNAGWSTFCHDTEVKTWGAGDEHLSVRWSFFKYGQHIRLIGDNGGRLEAVFKDDLTGLISHTFLAEGYIESDPI